MSREIATDLFNGVWQLLERDDRSIEDDDRQLLLSDLATISGLSQQRQPLCPWRPARPLRPGGSPSIKTVS